MSRSHVRGGIVQLLGTDLVALIPLTATKVKWPIDNVVSDPAAADKLDVDAAGEVMTWKAGRALVFGKIDIQAPVANTSVYLKLRFYKEDETDVSPVLLEETWVTCFGNNSFVPNATHASIGPVMVSGAGPGTQFWVEAQTGLAGVDMRYSYRNLTLVPF